MRPADVTTPDPEEPTALRDEFANEIVTRNLRWIWGLTLASTGLLLIYMVLNLTLPAMRSRVLLGAQLADLAVTAVTLTALAWLRRQPPALRWCRWFPVAYLIVVFVVFDYYNLSALATAGETGSYILGVVAVGVLVMLPPRVFLPLLLGNHAIYLGLLAGTDATLRVRWFAAMDGTAGVLVAGLASWLLFSSRWSDFQRERLLARTNAELARANAEMNDLMAITAHDLRSPLEGVRRLLGVVRTRTEWGRDQIEGAVDTCLQSCGGMVDFVGRLLDAHAVEAAGKKLVMVERDLREDCAAAIERARPLAERKQQRLILTLPATAAMARAEAKTLAQAVDNLLANAVKFSPVSAAVECVLFARGAVWCIEVRDEGPGVPPAECATLFQKFHRGSARATGGESSSGLGLFIVKTAVEAMDGRVIYAAHETDGAQSNPRGAVFRVELPRA